MKKSIRVLLLVLSLLLVGFVAACGNSDQKSVDAVKEGLNIQLSTGDTQASVTGKITLPTTFDKFEGTITWASDKTSVVSVTGDVVRPDSDTAVKLTATIKLNDVTETKDFNVTVKAKEVTPGKTDAELVAEAKAALAIAFAQGDTADSVTSDLELPVTQGTVTVAWASNNDAVSAAGVVTRGEADVTVTLTATLTLNAATDTKAFIVTVKAAEPVGPTDAELVAEAKAALAITFAEGDNKDSVTANLTLPEVQGTVNVVWASNNAAISAAGAVTRGDADVTVTLTATLTLNAVTETRTFEVIVKAAEPVGPTEAEIKAVVDALEAIYANTIGDAAYELTENIELVTTVSELPVTWVSENTALVTATGVVTRPSFTQGGQDGGVEVRLTATIDFGTTTRNVDFDAWLPALAETLEEKVEQALIIATRFPTNDGYTSDIEFNTTVKYDNVDYPVTWVSANPAVIANDGKVTRPAPSAGDIEVEVTVTVTSGEISKSTVLTFKVLALEPSVVKENIAAAIASTKGDYIKLEGVTVIGKISGGIYIADESGVLYIYDNSVIHSSLVVGQVYDIEGVVDIYYGGPQLKHDGARALTAAASTAASVVIEPITDETIEDVASKPNPNGNHNAVSITYAYYELTAKVIIDKKEGATTNYDTWLVDPSYTGNTIIDTLDGTTAKSYLAPTLNVYYQSNKAAFADLHGKTVTIKFLLYGYRTDRNVWYGQYLGTNAEVVVQATDQEAVDLTKAGLSVDEYVFEAKTLDLAQEGLSGATVSWTSTNPALINAETGVVTLPASGAELVTLSATIKRGTVEDTKTFDVYVGELEALTVSQAQAVVKGNPVKTTGVVMGLISNGSWILQDATGAIILRPSSGQTLVIGQEIEIIGYRNDYNGLLQVEKFEFTVLNESVPTHQAVSIDEVELTAAALLPYQNMLVTRTNLVVTAVTSGNNFKQIALLDQASGKTINLRWDTRVTVSTELEVKFDLAKVDDIVTVTAPVNWFNTPQFGFNTLSNVEVTGSILVKVSTAAELTAALDAQAVKIELLADITLDAKLVINYAVELNGGNFTITGVDAQGSNIHAIEVEANDVVIKNLVVDAQTGYAIHVYNVTGVKLNAVTLKNAPKGGLLVNGATVEVTGLVLDNNAWGGVEVSKGQFATLDPKLTVVGAIDYTAAEASLAPVIWIDGKTTNDGWVVAPSLNEAIYNEEGKNQVWFTEKSASDAALSHDFNLSALTLDTSYSASKDVTLTNAVGEAVEFTRINTSINTQADSGTGVVLRIGSSYTNWGSPQLVTKTAIANLQKVELVISNWTTDADYNLDFASAINVETSVDGTSWAVVKDLKPEWNKARSANNAFTIDIDNAGAQALYFRIHVVSAGTQTGTYQLRLILLSLKFYS